MVLVDRADGTVTWANPSAEQMLNNPLPIGRPFGMPARSETSITSLDGASIAMKTSPGEFAGRPVYLISLIDISEDRREIRELTRVANTDPLTKLLHRGGLLDLVELDRPNLERPAALFVDLDDFKDINDTWGHDVGDIVLQTVGSRLLNILRAGDRLARWGGDEFVMLTTGSAAAARLVGRATAALADPITFPDGSEIVRATIGWAAARDENWDFTELVARADREMYRRKHVISIESTDVEDAGGSEVIDVRDRHPSAWS